jgi:hypothetical protein
MPHAGVQNLQIAVLGVGMTRSSYVWQSRHESLKVYNHNLVGQVAGRRTAWRANAPASVQTTSAESCRL